MRDEVSPLTRGPGPAEQDHAGDERAPTLRPPLRQSIALAPGMRSHQAQRREHRRRGADRTMRWRCVETFEQIRERRAADDQEPGAAGADLTRGKIPEPDAGPEVRREMRTIQVQGESR